jgi:hypothetical protein
MSEEKNIPQENSNEQITNSKKENVIKKNHKRLFQGRILYLQQHETSNHKYGNSCSAFAQSSQPGLEALCV